MRRVAMAVVWGLMLAGLCSGACSGSGGTEKKPARPARVEKSKRSPKAQHPPHSHSHLHPHKGSPHHHHDHPHPHMPGPNGHHHAY